MPATPQTQAIQLANALLAVGAQTYNLQQQIAGILSQWTQVNAGAIYNAMATAPVNSDGTLGTADGSAVVTHVMDPRVYTTLNRAISSNDLTALNTLVTSLNALLTGATVSQQAGFPQMLNKVVGG